MPLSHPDYAHVILASSTKLAPVYQAVPLDSSKTQCLEHVKHALIPTVRSAPLHLLSVQDVTPLLDTSSLLQESVNTVILLTS